MTEKRAHTIKLKVQEEDFGAAYSFVAGQLNRRDISQEVANEICLVFEALFQKILDLNLDKDTELEITRAKRLGGLSIRISFEGKLFDLYSDSEASIEEKLLRAYEDKLDCSYHAGYNIIDISVSRNYRRRLFACVIAALLAIVVYAPMDFFLDVSVRHQLLNGYVFPLETAYANAALMVGAPMVFFSLLKNLTDTYIVSRLRSGFRKLQARTLVTSIIAIVLAVVAGLLWRVPFAGLAGVASEYETAGFNRSFADIVTSSVPPSIFEPFESISPIPLMLVALLVTYALCSAGRHFDALCQAMDACYTLFSRMLHVVTAMMPVFCFLAFMDIMLTDGFGSVLLFLGYIFVTYASLLLLLGSYAARLRAHGIKVIPFVKTLIPLIRENLKIGSVINATPFNVRYCARNYGMNRSRLERNIAMLAQINLDGNCFIIMLIALLFLFLTGTSFAWFNLVGLGFLVLLLSFGAPNQPGSILIGVLIVIMYLHSNDLMCIAIVFEAFLGTAQNISNVIGNIVLAAIEEQTSTDSPA